MLFLTFKNGSTQRLVMDGGVTCEEARALVAEWVGVEAQHVYLWWTTQTDLFGSFPDDARLLQDDDQTVYHGGAIYFGVTNELGDDQGAGHASMPWLARFVQVGDHHQPVLVNVPNDVPIGLVWREIAHDWSDWAAFIPFNPNLPRIQDSLPDVGYDSDFDIEQVD